MTTQSKPSIAKYLQERDEYQNLPGKIINGKMKVFYKGKWVTPNVLKQFITPPVLPDFMANLHNVDTTKLWMYK